MESPDNLKLCLSRSKFHMWSDGKIKLINLSIRRVSLW